MLECHYSCSLVRVFICCICKAVLRAGIQLLGDVAWRWGLGWGRRQRTRVLSFRELICSLLSEPQGARDSKRPLQVSGARL